VVLLGASYLENADDTRNTPAAALAKLLLAQGVEVVAHDPYVRKADWARVLGDGHDVPLTADLDAALREADCAALVTRHREYETLDFQRMKDVMRAPPILVDGRNAFHPVEYALGGFTVRALGQIGP
jgi:UDP-N-acetyl-D-mannosaminuronate dehydrogenase